MLRRRPAALVVSVSLLVVAAAAGAASVGRSIAAVAVFPVENLSGDNVPADEVRQFLVNRLAAEGVRVLGTDALEAFMARHRVRYAAGIDAATAESLRKETGVDGVVIASIEQSNRVAPPKVAVMARLVSITASPVVVWADDAGLAGDDAPGLFELGMVNDYEVLQARALDRLGGSLAAYVRTGDAGAAPKAASKFRPKRSYRRITMDPGRTYSIAALPFFNLSGRRNAGEILALLFMRHFSGLPQLRVIETGVARRQLLDARIIMDGGLSITDAETVATLVEADFILGGQVLSYQDYEGPAGRTRVEFSTVLIERSSRRVVWSSNSYNDGDDGVLFFGRGTSRTAHAMATQMVRRATDQILGRGR